MYHVGIPQLLRERTVNGKTGLCVAMLAGGWFALAATSAVSAQEAVDENEAVVEADPQKAVAEAASTDAAQVGAAERQPGQSTAAEELAAIERDAVAKTEPESPQAKQVCRRVEVTGTHFTRRECRTVEEWADLQSQQSTQGRRFVRDVQSQSTVIPAPGPGQDTAQGRPSGLPNPGSL